MLSIPEAIAYQKRAAATKVSATKNPLAYLVQSMLAGSYIGVAVILMVSAAGPFLLVDSPAVKLIGGLVFGVALTLVLIAGGELVTSNMMTLTQGALGRTISWGKWVSTLVFCFFGNVLGAFVFAGLIHFTGLLERDTAAGKMLISMLEGKGHESSVELFFRGILCNMLVCLAIWSAVRLKTEIARLTVIFWCLLAFITSGFEHVVANMTTFGIGLFGGFPETNWLEFARNMTVVGFGNLVGGGLIVGLGYFIVSGNSLRKTPATPQLAVPFEQKIRHDVVYDKL